MPEHTTYILEWRWGHGVFGWARVPDRGHQISALRAGTFLKCHEVPIQFDSRSFGNVCYNNPGILGDHQLDMAMFDLTELLKIAEYPWKVHFFRKIWSNESNYCKWTYNYHQLSLPLGNNVGHTLDPTNSHVTGDAKVCSFWIRQVGMVSGGFVMQVVPSFSILKKIKLN